jgi:hypothetical protein
VRLGSKSTAITPSGTTIVSGAKYATRASPAVRARVGFTATRLPDGEQELGREARMQGRPTRPLLSRVGRGVARPGKCSGMSYVLLEPGQLPVRRAKPVAPARSMSALDQDLAPASSLVCRLWRVAFFPDRAPDALEDRTCDDPAENAHEQTDRFVEEARHLGATCPIPRVMTRVAL